jgi:uncharacterized membrane protein
MTAGIMNLAMVGVMGIITFMIVRSVATNICLNTTGWSTTESTLICEILGIVVATAIIFAIFYVMKGFASGKGGA